MAADREFDALDPGPDAFREAGYEVIDRMAAHYERVREVDAFPDVTPAELAAEFDDPLPESGEDLATLLAEWDDRVYPNAAQQGSPRWFGFVMGSGTPVGALAEALAASVNMNAGAWFGGPVATEVERQCLRWLAELVGYPPDCGGVLTSGGTMANHAAVYVALQDATDFDARETGLRGLGGDGRFRLYESAHEGHSSVTRVARMTGLGTDAVRPVPCDDEYRMDPDALDRLLTEDAANGDEPVCVVAQVGSINVSAVDPLAAVADVCADHDVWFHADGACGAVGAVLPEKADLYDGLDRADSVTLDPHKWLSVPYGCGCVLFRDPQIQARAFSMHAAYLDETDEKTYHGTNFAYRGPEMSRPFRALKLWLSLKHRGVEGYRRLLRQGCLCAEHLHDLVDDAGDFETLQEPNLFIYSFRYRPADLRERDESGTEDRSTGDPAAADSTVEDYLDWLNQRVADDLRLSGEAFVTTTEVAGHTAIRMSICSHRTTPADVDRTVDALREHGARVDAENRGRMADGGD